MQRQAALVTGGAIRLGKAISLALAEKGFDIALHHHSSQREADETANEVRQFGVACAPFRLDLVQVDAVPDLIAQVLGTFPHLSLLINNASRFKSSTILETKNKFFDDLFAINFRAPFFLMQEFAKRCAGEHIINILDTKIFSNDSDYAAYYLSKKALANLTKMAALEFAPHIRVNAIAPGPTIPTAGTGMTEFDKETIRAIPLKRTGETENVTMALLHLVENTFINGHILRVDGGESLSV